MIGIVVVSHSPALARAAVDLADQMVTGAGPAVAIAAGSGGRLGTDATDVADALSRVTSPEGTLVLMDLGSAVLSAEMALELSPQAGEVRLCPAPLVEGLVAAVVKAAGGASLAEVAREAETALLPKMTALATYAPPGGHADVQDDAPSHDDSADTVSGSAVVVNDGGLHARPAAQIAAAVGALSVHALVSCRDRTADAASSLELMMLQAGRGAEVSVSATGPDAALAVRAVLDLVVGGFGELQEQASQRPA